MRIKLVYKCILSVFMVFWSVSVTAQTHSLPQPQMTDSTKDPDVVVPPGLAVPIDEHSYLLVIAGLGAGIYMLRLRKKV